MGVATGCGCKEHPYFLFIFLNVFRSCIYIIVVYTYAHYNYECHLHFYLTPHEYCMILPDLGISVASVTTISFSGDISSKNSASLIFWHPFPQMG